MQKGREQLEIMLGTEPGGKSSTQHASFDDITQHDELRKVIDEGKIHPRISVVLIGNFLAVESCTTTTTTTSV